MKLCISHVALCVLLALTSGISAVAAVELKPNPSGSSPAESRPQEYGYKGPRYKVSSLKNIRPRPRSSLNNGGAHFESGAVKRSLGGVEPQSEGPKARMFKFTVVKQLRTKPRRSLDDNAHF